MHLPKGLQFAEHLIEFTLQSLELLLNAGRPRTRRTVRSAGSFGSSATQRRTKAASRSARRRTFAKTAPPAAGATFAAARWRSIVPRPFFPPGLIPPWFFALSFVAPRILATGFIATGFIAAIRFAFAPLATLLCDELERFTVPYWPHQTARRRRLRSRNACPWQQGQQAAHGRQ